ncbi:MAG: Peptidase M16 inactive domain protein [Parcubacteria bacterium OLB19]|nr:MAG: Peptidase M16 inactive domain protein [Parcubacteria bacterium OLB19]
MYNFSEFGVDYKTSFLKNKPKICILKRKGAPIHIQACIHAGSRNNSMSGQAHFLEHMLVNGTRLYPSKVLLAEALEKVGGYFEATTDADLIRITVSVSQRKDISLAVTILNEILTASLYREDVFENERQVILREQKDRLRNSSLILMDVFMKQVYSDFELRFQNLGTHESVNNLQLKDIVDFAKNNITIEKTTFIVSGDVEMRDVENLLSEIKLPHGLEKSFIRPQILIKNERVVCKKQEGENSDILIGFRCDTETLEDVAGLLLIKQMFTGRGSCLIQELRYKRGLVYGGGVPFWDFNGTSLFGLRTTCATEKIEEVLDVTLNVLKEIYLKGISELEYDNLKIKMDSHYRFNLQTSKEWLEAEVSAERHNIKDDKNMNALSIPSFIKQINANRLTEIFRKYIDLKYAHIVISGSVSENSLEHINKSLSY